MSEPIHPQRTAQKEREEHERFARETEGMSPFEFFAYFKDFKGIIPISNPTA
jgi:hypothetical protein